MEADLRFTDGLGPEDLVDAFGDLPDALEDELADAGDDIGARIRGAADEDAPVDEGRLSSSMEHVATVVGGTILRIVVGTNVDYARPLEEGTDPFFPPPSELRGWAARNLGDPDLAYPVARSIAETGIDEHRFLRDALEENIEYALDRLLEAVRDAFGEVGLV